MSRFYSKSGLIVCGLVFVVLAPANLARAQVNADPTYEKDLRPLFKKHCTACHNQRKIANADVSGGLALDSYEAIQVARQRKAAIFSGGEKSALLQRLTAPDDEKRMPQGGEALTAAEIDLVRHWLASDLRRGEPTSPGSATLVPAKPATKHRKPIIYTTGFQTPKGFMGGFAPKLQLKLPFGVLAPITALSYSPDGKTLAVGSYKQVILWDLDSVTPRLILADFAAAVHDVHFNADGSLLLVAGGQAGVEGLACIYDFKQSKWTHTIPIGQDVINSAAFDPAGPMLAFGCEDKKVYLWSLEKRALERTLTGHSDGVTAVAYSPDGQCLLSAGKDRSLKIISPSTGRTKTSISRNEEDLALAFHPVANEAVGAGVNPAISWWDLNKYNRLRQLRVHILPVNDLAFDRRGTVLASASSDKTVNLWNGKNGAQMRTLSTDTPLFAVAVQPDGAQVAAGGFDGSTIIWDIKSGRRLLALTAFRDSQGRTQWLTYIPEGYVSASPDAKDSVIWTNEKNFTQSHVWTLLENPKLIAKAAHGAIVSFPKTIGGADTRLPGKP